MHNYRYSYSQILTYTTTILNPRMGDLDACGTVVLQSFRPLVQALGFKGEVPGFLGLGSKFTGFRGSLIFNCK